MGTSCLTNYDIQQYLHQDKFEQAEELYRKALKAIQKILGPEHPTTLDTMGDIGWVLYHKGNYTAAEEIARAAVEGYDRICKPKVKGPLKVLIHSRRFSGVRVSISRLKKYNAGRWWAARGSSELIIELPL
jgi:tetratricopeptide (TPR) repeat protein